MTSSSVGSYSYKLPMIWKCSHYIDLQTYHTFAWTTISVDFGGNPAERDQDAIISEVAGRLGEIGDMINVSQMSSLPEGTRFQNNFTLYVVLPLFLGVITPSPPKRTLGHNIMTPSQYFTTEVIILHYGMSLYYMIKRLGVVILQPLS